MTSNVTRSKRYTIRYTSVPASTLSVGLALQLGIFELHVILRHVHCAPNEPNEIALEVKGTSYTFSYSPSQNSVLSTPPAVLECQEYIETISPNDPKNNDEHYETNTFTRAIVMKIQERSE